MQQRLLLLSFLLATLFPLLHADSLNIAPYSRPFVSYVGSMPPLASNSNFPDPKKIDPNNFIDRSFGTVVEFRAAPISNIGSSFGIEMAESLMISSIVIRNIFNYPSASIRLRGFEVLASKDGQEWTSLQTAFNNDSLYGFYTLPINSTQRWKFIKIQILSMHQNASTVIGELEVYTMLDPTQVAVSSLSVQPQTFTNSSSKCSISWTTQQHPANAFVRISWKSVWASSFTVISDQELNDGKYEWNTTYIPDGSITVAVEPVVTGKKIGLTQRIDIANIGLEVVDLYPHNFNGILEYYSYMMSDSINIKWTAAPRLSLPYHFRPIISTDSGKTWSIAGPTIADASLRSVRIGMLPDMVPSTRGMVGIEAVVDTMVLAHSWNPSTKIVGGKPRVGEQQWVKGYPSTIGVSYEGSMASHPDDGTGATIVAGPRWKLTINGDSVNPAWSSIKSPGYVALSDMDGNGSLEVISPSVYNSAGTPLFMDTLGVFGKHPMVDDINADGVPEIVSVDGKSVVIISNDGRLVRKLTIPTTSTKGLHPPGLIELDAQPGKELLISVVEDNTLYAFNVNGLGVSGFPIILSDVIVAPPLSADLDNDGGSEIIVVCRNTLYCFTTAGTLRPGFPVNIPSSVLKQLPAIADLDNDGFLDIIFTSTVSALTVDKQRSFVHCIDRHGKYINGWPVEIRDGFVTITSDNGNIFMNESNSFMLMQYILSIDGDWNNEVVLFNSNGFMYVIDRFGNYRQDLTTFIGPMTNIYPHFADPDNNGSLNAYIPVLFQYGIKIIALDFGPGSFNPSRMPWPTYRQNAARTGVPAKPVLVSVDRRTSSVHDFSLEQNFPNPFNPATTIEFSVPAKEHVVLRINDILGREVATLVDQDLAPGQYQRTFHAGQLNSGVYFYTLTVGQHTDTKRMTLIK
ncbi:MAG: T9SS type A sorting domain-containing protein [Bacteroidetes bacterium]|nr:T9SS type A sorting domain-containing protein [Bacteroidota bacterium]